MPADPDRQVGDHLSHLRADVDQVSWAGADAVRGRGDRRTRNHAVAGAMTTLAVVGAAGFGLFGGQVLGGSDDVAGVPREPQPAPTETESPADSPAEEDADSPPEESPEEDGAEDSPADDTDQSPDDEPSSPDEPTDSESETDPTPDDEPTDDDSTGGQELMLENTEGLLLAPEDMFPINDTVSWTTAETHSRGSGTVSNCQSSTLEALGAEGTSQRDYDPDNGEDTPTGAHVAGVFESEDAASEAYDSLVAAVDGCSWGEPNEPNEVSVETGSAAWWFVGTQTDDGDGEFEVIGLAQRDSGVAVMVMHQDGYDYNDNDPSGTVSTAWSLLEAS